MKVVILSDNKPGHYKQSLGIAKYLTDYDIEWQDIQFHSKLRDNLLRIFFCIFGCFSLNSYSIKFLLKWSLHPSIYNSLLNKNSVDVVLSTGSSLAVVNLLLGKLYQAKTITCRRPSPIGVRHFDMAILPMLSWHKTKKQENVCKTIGVPNPITPDELNKKEPIYSETLNLDSRKCIGILIGGTDKSETITIDDVSQLINTIDSVVTKLNIQVLLTTSRRTPSEVTLYLKSHLDTRDWCSLFIEPSSTSMIDEPYEAILALSDLLIVTADSFSMVCEAASTGKKVIVLSMTQTAIRMPSRYKVYTYMKDYSIISLSNRDDLSSIITEQLETNIVNKKLQDTETAVKAIRGLLDSNN
ncbi:mitochondrial fission ELM1 family protein [Candidatus Poribacteria bacterium]|nr:mitochondrial fission ELM1 family protein [Candidatus Poribacteria bacterium]